MSLLLQKVVECSRNCKDEDEEGEDPDADALTSCLRTNEKAAQVAQRLWGP